MGPVYTVCRSIGIRTRLYDGTAHDTLPVDPCPSSRHLGYKTSPVNALSMELAHIHVQGLVRMRFDLCLPCGTT